MSEFLWQIGRLGSCGSSFFSVRYLVGRAFCNLAGFLEPGWQSIKVSNPPPLAQQFGTLPTQPTIHETSHRWLNTLVSKRFPLCKTFRKSWSKYKWNALRRWKCSGKSRTSLTKRSGPTKSCHSFFKHFRVQFYMTDREIINIKVSVKTFSNGTPRLGWKFCFYPAMCFYFLLNYFQWSLTCLSGLRERAHSDSVIVKDTQYPQYIINRGYYMAARRYEISLRVLKNISLVRCAHSWNIFNTRREISYLQAAM